MLGYLARMRSVANRRQNDVAEAIGLSRSTISQKLKGDRPLTVDEFLKFAEFFGVDPGELLTGRPSIPTIGRDFRLPPVTGITTLPATPTVEIPLDRESEEAMPERKMYAVLQRIWLLGQRFGDDKVADVVDDTVFRIETALREEHEGKAARHSGGGR